MAAYDPNAETQLMDDDPEIQEMDEHDPDDPGDGSWTPRNVYHIPMEHHGDGAPIYHAETTDRSSECAEGGSYSDSYSSSEDENIESACALDKSSEDKRAEKANEVECHETPKRKMATTDRSECAESGSYTDSYSSSEDENTEKATALDKSSEAYKTLIRIL